MSEVINLSENIISKKDREKMESFGGHTVSHGRATRWHWHKIENGDDVFELFSGGAVEVMAICISRSRKADSYYAHDMKGNMVSSGKLDNVMTGLEQYFIELHGE